MFNVRTGWISDFWKSIACRNLWLRAAAIREQSARRRARIGSGETLEPRTLLSAYVVNSAADNTTAGDGLTTLREAIALANANPGADTIAFGNGAGVGGTNFTDGVADTITLSLGEFLITESVSITGLSADKTIIDGNNSSRIFSITSGDTTLEKLTLTRGRTTAASEKGGAIRSKTTGTLTVSQSTLSGNSTAGNYSDGGAIYSNYSSIVVSQSTLSGNSTTGDFARGGAIFNYSGAVSVTLSTLSGNFTTQIGAKGGAISSYGGAVTVSKSTLTGNSTAGNSAHGGAIYAASGALTVSQSTLSGNSTAGDSTYGGAIFSYDGSVKVSDSTLSGNSTTGNGAKGGAVFSISSPVTVNQSTLSENTTEGIYSQGAGIYSRSGAVTVSQSTLTGNRTDLSAGGGIFSASAPIVVRNSIVAGNSDNGTAPDIRKSPSAALTVSHSLIGDNTGTGLTATVGSTTDSNGNFVGGAGASALDPLLSPLQDNGGATFTHGLLTGSLALNHGDNTLIPLDAFDLDGDFNTTEVVPFDQRGVGFSRIVGSAVDIGATEFIEAASLVITTASDVVDNTDGLTSLREAVAYANSKSGADVITFGDGSGLGGTNFTDATPDTIKLTLGQMVISETVTITGHGASSTFIDAQQSSRIFDITNAAGNVTIALLALKNGRTTGSGTDWSDPTFKGGAIRSRSLGTLAIVQSTLSDNSTTGDYAFGGAIYSERGAVSIQLSNISGNSTAGFLAGGGAIATQYGDITLNQSQVTANSTSGSNSSGGSIWSSAGRVLITTSSLSGNSTSGNSSNGGAVLSANGGLTVVQSTLSGNTTHGPTSHGGAIYARTSLRINQSTISSNSTLGANSDGGGVFGIAGDMTVFQSTIANNAATGRGGGIGSLAEGITITSSIVAGNNDNGTASDVQKSDALTVTYSLIGKATGTALSPSVGNNSDNNGNYIGASGSPINPQLGPLQNNGGPTLTHALLAGSLAINTGVEIVVDTLDLDGDFNTSEYVPFDQRGAGFPRISGLRIDMGATEGPPPPIVTLENTVTTIAENTSTATRTRVADIVVLSDGLGTNTLNLTGVDAAAFEIVGNQLFLKAGVVLNFEAKSSYEVVVTVDDSRFITSPDSVVVLTLNVTNVAEAPVVTGPLSFTFEEFSPRWTIIGKLNATDPEGDALSYSFVSGNFDNTLFIGDGSVPADGGRLWVYQQDLTGLRHRGMFNLKVRVTDNSVQALFTDVDVQIFITSSQNGTTRLNPVVDGSVNDAGGNGFDSGDVVNSSGTGMLVQGGATPSRGVIEFDLRSMPTNRTLKNAWLFFSTSALVGGATVSVPIDIFGYSGDGALTAADALLGTKIGARPISNSDGSNQLKIHSAPLDVSYVQGIVGNSRLGLVFRNDGTSDGVVINTSESSVSTDQKPYLVLQFGDLQPDLIIRDNGPTGTGNQILTLGSNGSSFTVNTASVFAAGSWERFLTGDFNGDGRTDIAGRLSTDGSWWISLANASGVHQTATQWGAWSTATTWNDVLVADFDGDGKADIAGRVSNGDWWVSRSTGTALSAKLWGNWSSANTWSNATVGDFNRDGRMDIAGRNNLGEWFVSRSTGTTPADAAFATAKWGLWSTATIWTDVQIGDFNGDGRTDIAGRSSIGQWWVNRSTGTSFGAAIYYGLWSTGTTWSDVRVADFNGDGRDDILGRSTIGQWWVAETAVTASFTMKLLGTRTAPQSQWGEMVVGDFNRDGRADIATRKTTDNTVWVSLWTIAGSTPSFVTTNWATLPATGSPQWTFLKSARLNG